MSNTPTHGSDEQETPDWWKASDGRFYSPELHPDYVKPADPDFASSEPSLADRLPVEPDRVGDQAAAAADAGVGSIGSSSDTAGVAVSGAGAAGTDAVKDGMSPTPESIDPRATSSQMPAANSGQTIIQQPSMAPSPGMPPAPGMGIQPPATPPAKASSRTSGLIALVGGAAAVAGSLLQWGKGAVTGINGVEKAIIEVPGFDSSGLITAVAGGVLILAGILFFMGVPKQTNWVVLAFLGGAVIVGTVVFSMIDIGDLSNRYAAQWQAEGRASTGDVISTNGDIGLWVTGAGGVLGVLAAPFAKRS
jgi:hypothetical protein